VEEDIGAFEVAMENIDVMQGFQSLDELDEDAPDVILAQVGLLFLVARNFLKEVTIIGILHDDAVKW